MLPTIKSPFNSPSTTEPTLPDSKKAQFWLAGDHVLWKGIKLTVHSVDENGRILAISPTFQVYVTDSKEFTRFSEVHNDAP